MQNILCMICLGFSLYLVYSARAYVIFAQFFNEIGLSYFQLFCCSQELKKEKLKYASAIKELQEKAEQKLREELKMKVCQICSLSTINSLKYIYVSSLG